MVSFQSNRLNLNLDQADIFLSHFLVNKFKGMFTICGTVLKTYKREGTTKEIWVKTCRYKKVDLYNYYYTDNKLTFCSVFVFVLVFVVHHIISVYIIGVLGK